MTVAPDPEDGGLPCAYADPIQAARENPAQAEPEKADD